MPENTPALVVVAAGGLGTRVHDWAQFIPKEFYPVNGRPGIVRLLEEIAGLGPARVAVVYHPYYEQFATWSRQVLGGDSHNRYARQAGLDIPAAISPDITISLIPQRGAYGDLTSVINGADCLAAVDGLYVAFADNLYIGPAPLPLLRAASGDDVTVLASTYRPALAPSRGILITDSGSGTEPRQVKALIEKPDPAQARALEEEHGPASLLMLEGRVRLTAPFLRFARSGRHAVPGSEPKLSTAIGAYARDHQAIAIPVPGDVIDLGTPEVQLPANDERSICHTWSAGVVNSGVGSARDGDRRS